MRGGDIHLGLGLSNLGLMTLVLVGVGSELAIDIVITDLDVVNDLGVEGEGALGNEGGGEQHNGDNSVHDTSDVNERRADVTLVVGCVDGRSQDRSQDGV